MSHHVETIETIKNSCFKNNCGEPAISLFFFALVYDRLNNLIALLSAPGHFYFHKNKKVLDYNLDLKSMATVQGYGGQVYERTNKMGTLLRSRLLEGCTPSHPPLIRACVYSKATKDRQVSKAWVAVKNL